MLRALATIAVLVGATGCDVVYGLTGRDSGVDASIDTIDADPCPNDRDCDFVGDPIDNCPDVANSGQDDRDEDDVGDACDTCLARPSTADEDSDGVADRLDNCPMVINVDQTNADGDDVGDACDPRPSVGGDSLSCFMSFGDVDETERVWSITAAPWVVQNGQVEHYQPAVDPFTIIHQPSHLLAAGASYELRTIVTFGSTFGASFQIGFGVGAPALTDRGVRCVFDGTFGVSSSVTLLDASDTILQQASLPTFTTVQAHVTFRIEPHGTTTTLTCAVSDSGNTPTAITGEGPPLAAEPTLRVISSNAYGAFPWLATYLLGP